MSFHDRYHVDKVAEEEGTWVELGEGTKVKLRRHTSAHARAARRLLEEPHAALFRNGGQPPEDILEDILTKQMAISLVAGWKGVTDKEGVEVAATPELIEKTLREYPDFRNELGSLVMARTTFKKLVREEDLKNS